MIFVSKMRFVFKMGFEVRMLQIIPLFKRTVIHKPLPPGRLKNLVKKRIPDPHGFPSVIFWAIQTLPK